MEPILEQIRATYDSGIWYPVVSSMLMLPDACGAAEFWGQEKKPRQRYIEWYDKWVAPHFSPANVKFDGSVVYIIRNALMHEATGFTRGTHGFDRVLFTPPNQHGVVLEFFLSQTQNETAFQVTILGMLNAIENGVRNWLTEIRADDEKRRENAVAKLLQYRPDGQPPHIIGIPVVS
ncbi:hypothetical protein [Novosphingobium sp. JCM 18896]|uniref:hypothetical protein n=1 Tax=Novosphingobium sp. JCM 18896 TaxID=2989731 RepID=UPI0022217F5D|nr:hypothetical protein [Novosphingobium sp. JCM 18896]MCW1428042.1 hypothetical protein [Novosphingobium sp. JCM 18896]